MSENNNKDDVIGKNKIIWMIVFIIIACATVWAIIGQSKGFSAEIIYGFINRIDPIFFVLSGLCVLGFVFFEALAIKIMGKSFGHNIKMRKALSYSSGDIYFSAITPSATGGQPVCAYFMIKDGLPLSFSTMSIILNLMMYTASLTIIGIITVILKPSIYLSFSLLSKILIGVGAFIQLILIIVFFLLLTKESLCEKLLIKIVYFLHKIHIVKDPEKKIAKRRKSIDAYNSCIAHLKEDKKLLFKILFCNLGQRTSQIIIPAIIIFGAGGSFKTAVMVWFIQTMVTLGSYVIPIPGAMGVTDLLMLDGFSQIVAPNTATNLEIVSRGIQFYICILFCGIISLIKYIKIKKGVNLS